MVAHVQTARSVVRTVSGVDCVSTDSPSCSACTVGGFDGPRTVGLSGGVHKNGWVMGASADGPGSGVSRVVGAGAVHKVDEVHSVPTLHGVRVVHTVCGDVGGQRVGGQRGVCTASGEG